MIRNYLKIAYRNLVRHKIYSLINISGLAIGIAFCILTFLYVRHEWTYDAFHGNGDRIYRVVTEMKGRGGRMMRGAMAPVLLRDLLLEEAPGVVNAVRFSRSEALVRSEAAAFVEQVMFADPSVFDMFSFPLVEGAPAQVLQSPHSAVISEAFAEKYFGEKPPVGEPLWIKPDRWSPKQAFIVSGVVGRIPANSTIRFDLLLPIDAARTLWKWNMDWYASWSSLYVELAPGVSASETAPIISGLNEGHNPWARRRPVRLTLQPLRDIHLSPEVWSREWEPISNPVYSYVLAGIALLVLAVACINFVNLAIGQSYTRVCEVGIRKVIGARRCQLVVQFWSEFTLLGVVALILGLAVAELSLPMFNGFVQRELSLTSAFDGMAVAALLGLLVVVGVLSGSYPALVLSGLQPAAVLTSRLKLGGRHFVGRALVVFQFVLSVLLVVCMLVMTRQTHLMKHKDLHFSPDHVVMISTRHLEGGNRRFLDAYRQELASQPGVLEMTGVVDAFEWGKAGGSAKNREGERVAFARYFVDYNFLSTLKVGLIAGRNFSEQFPGDAAKAVIVNEALVHAMGWDDPVGKVLPFESPDGRAKVVNPKSEDDYVHVKDPVVIGVVKDFHFRSLHHAIAPTIMILQPLIGSGSYILARISAERVDETLALLDAMWTQIAPNVPFEWTFLDEHFAAQYRGEERWTQIVMSASLFAIFIACLGAFGLTALAVARRTKEIGIRKILGASVPNIVRLLSREFVLLVGIANVIAWPIAWWAISKWLSNFAYRIDPGVGTFVLGGVLTLAVVLLTVGSQAVRAARANPVDALRYE